MGMRKTVVFLTVLCLLGMVTCLRADYARIGLDSARENHFDDWASVPKVGDPNGDAGLRLDIVETAMANDEYDLFFYVRVSGDHSFGDVQEYLYFYLDTDNNSGTGHLIGPAGQQVGAEYRYEVLRRYKADGSGAAGVDLGQYFDGYGWYSLGYGDSAGVRISTIEDSSRIELAACFNGSYSKLIDGSFQPLLHIGDTIAYVAAATTTLDPDDEEWPQEGGQGWDSDWLDVAQTYTIAAGCGDTSHMYPEGDVNQDCDVGLDDLAMLAEEWLLCTDPTGAGCTDLGWF